MLKILYKYFVIGYIKIYLRISTVTIIIILFNYFNLDYIFTHIIKITKYFVIKIIIIKYF